MASLITTILFWLVLLLIVLALIAPFESLFWWAGWGAANPPTVDDELPSTQPARPASGPFLVYLSGIMDISGDTMGVKEEYVLNLLAERLPGAVIMADIFPYSAADRPLTRSRVFARFWKFVEGRRENHGHVAWANVLVALRNVLQVTVSADPRYGTIYSFGIARAIAERLARRGYHAGSGAPIFLLGLSGGGQIAVGCVPLLRRMLGAPIYVVSIGGVLTDDPGVLEAAHLYHLSGSRDIVQHIGEVMFPGRWPIALSSAWNRAREEGRLTFIDVGPMHHTGHGDYFSRSARLPDGCSYGEKTADVIAEIVRSVSQRADAASAGQRRPELARKA